MIGDFQVYNSLCAICLVYFSGISINKCLKAIKKINNFLKPLLFRMFTACADKIQSQKVTSAVL